MALWSRIYYNAVYGGLGGLVGWMLFGVFGNRSPSIERSQLFLTYESLNSLLGGALIGMAIGFFVVGVEAIRDQSLVRFARLGSYGALLSWGGGALGMFAGDAVNVGCMDLWRFFFGIPPAAIETIIGIFARGLGWSLLGIAIGASEGIAARSLGKFSYGTIGGLLGGFIGGVLFQIFYSHARLEGSSTYFWNAMGLVILGACIGSLSALVTGVFVPASVKVMRGWQEGREYGLDKPASLLGRDEHADIALFRDMKVEKKHAYIKRQGKAFILVNNGAPPGQTLVNEQQVADSRELGDGDRIQLGNVLLRFQLRAAVNRARPKPRLAAT
jgi:Inner membrane component of T3SS, cytoplasmic domain